MDDLWKGVVEDFSDIPSIAESLRFLVRLVLAAALGGLLGFERARSGKSAGLRTHMLVALGSALFAMIPQQAGVTLTDMSRVVQGIVTGIGFIGAGAILKQSESQQVHGLTTAAGLWLTAAIGMSAGMGREMTAILGAVLAFVILAALQGVESRVTRSLNQTAGALERAAGDTVRMKIEPLPRQGNEGSA
ncbi:putative Mg(2+) transport ATPase [Caulifigura coniformis]|uniref:Putative Mg(2+) transport ATPase n=1 Tax=Caulifigura coniformis TaxID=2527983 RepID=A0A517S7X8_9PLAN|nr:MgtC/SapB family protein [Caulifigura coniformis]QDT52235.1 putative Mg(2+) transport ATPase [Caulifigura coniformis]